MSASASVYTLTPLSFWRVGRLLVGLRGGSGFPNWLILIGLAEAKRLKQGPDMGFNWIGSTGFCRLHEVVACGLC